MMFELRFEERQTIRVSTGCTGTEKILQMRTKDVWVDSNTTTPTKPRWSEWKDIPIVQEDELRNI